MTPNMAVKLSQHGMSRWPSSAGPAAHLRLLASAAMRRVRLNSNVDMAAFGTPHHHPVQEPEASQFMRIKLLSCLVAVLAACGENTQKFPDGVVGILHVDAETDFVFRSATSTVGGRCVGWNTVSVQKRGQDSTAMNHLMCWQERSGMVYTSTAKAEGTTVVPLKAITTPY